MIRRLVRAVLPAQGVDALKHIEKVLRYYLKRRSVQRALDHVLDTSQIIIVHLETTNICNAKCVFCAYPEMERAHTTMAMEPFTKVVDKCIAEGVVRFSLTPVVGDPMADKHFFERLVYFADVGAHSVDFVTNCIAFTPSKIEKFIAFKKARPELRTPISVSLGGVDAETYRSTFRVDSFAQVERNLPQLLSRLEEEKIANSVLIHLRCPNVDADSAFFKRLKAFEARGICKVSHDRTMAYGNWGGKVDVDKMEAMGYQVAKPPRRFFGPCDLMFSKGVVVSGDGSVNACACRDVELTLPIGNILETNSSLSDVLKGQKRRDMVNAFMDGIPPETCHRCSEYLSIFDPGSKFRQKYVEQEHGDPFADDAKKGN